MTFDLEAFETYLLVSAGPDGDGWASVTVAKSLERLARYRRQGLDLSAMAEDSQAEADRFLAGLKKADATRHQLNNAIKVLNPLAEFFDQPRVGKKLPEPRHQYRALNEEQLGRLLRWRHENPKTSYLHRAVIAGFYATAMRPSELAAMTLDDVDAHERRIMVRYPAKDGLRRWLPMEPWVFSTQRPFGAYASWRLAHGHELDTGAFWVSNRRGSLPSRRGWSQLSAEYLRSIPYYAGRDLGLEVNATILRHTRATNLRRAGWDLLALRTWLGHADVRSTQIYAEVRPEDLDLMLEARPAKDPLGAP